VNHFSFVRLVATAFQSMRLMKGDFLSSNFTPKDLASGDLPLIAGVSMTPKLVFKPVRCGCVNPSFLNLSHLSSHQWQKSCIKAREMSVDDATRFDTGLQLSAIEFRGSAAALSTSRRV